MTGNLCRPFGARSILEALTQGSQSLALGLTLIALLRSFVEWSRPVWSG